MKGRFVSSVVLCTATILLFCQVGTCQFTEVLEKIQETQTLAGVVRIEDADFPGEKGVLVEDCSSDWGQIFASTRTDDLGHFKLPDTSKAKLHYLRFSKYAVRTELVKARIVKRGPKELSINLDNAT